MTTLPPILIVTDRGHLVAYRLLPGAGPEVLRRADFSEGTDKISEIMTDQAGRLASGGTEGHRMSAAERPRLVLELETRCVRHIAEHITELLTAYSDGPVTDIGCGDLEVLQVFDLNDYTGFDLSARGLDLALTER